jgi:hypothetical protein
MVPSKPMCVEAFTDYPPLGRFVSSSVLELHWPLLTLILRLSVI